jgi:hypothetical protein
MSYPLLEDKASKPSKNKRVSPSRIYFERQTGATGNTILFRSDPKGTSTAAKIAPLRGGRMDSCAPGGSITGGYAGTPNTCNMSALVSDVVVYGFLTAGVAGTTWKLQGRKKGTSTWYDLTMYSASTLATVSSFTDGGIVIVRLQECAPIDEIRAAVAATAGDTYTFVLTAALH